MLNLMVHWCDGLKIMCKDLYKIFGIQDIFPFVLGDILIQFMWLTFSSCLIVVYSMKELWNLVTILVLGMFVVDI